MRAWIANTDYDWYAFLSSRPGLTEVNFWMPSDRRRFAAVPIGSPFIFKLKASYNHFIVGFGYLQRWTVLPAWLAWDTFEQANGAPDFVTMNRRIARYRKGPYDPIGNYEIGCLLIAEPVFFAERDWIASPHDWARNIVQGKTYDVAIGEGRRIYETCLALAAPRRTSQAAGQAGESRFGKPTLVAPRLGQGGFRVAVLDAYGRSCAISTEHSLPALEAAHIKPYADSGEHAVNNGILLRADIHRLFDRGYVTITPDYRFVVSRRLREDYENGRVYYEYERRPSIALPANREDWPAQKSLEWHNDNRFVA